MPRVIHFEIPAENPERAMDFYKNVFGWTFQGMPGMEYWFIDTGKEDMGINGAIMKRPGPITNNISVGSIEDYTNKITAAGGEIVVPKTTIPGMGYYSYFKDTEGNISGIWQDDKNAQL